MSQADSALFIFGILVPLVLLQTVFAATFSAILILVGLTVYYRVHKANIKKTHPDKLLLEEIRSLTTGGNNEQGKKRRRSFEG